MPLQLFNMPDSAVPLLWNAPSPVGKLALIYDTLRRQQRGSPMLLRMLLQLHKHTHRLGGSVI